MAIVLSCIFAACDKVGEKQVPVYKGMTISRSFATSSAATAAEDNGNHYGHFKGDHNNRNDEVDQNKPFEDPNAPSIENKANSTLDVVGSAESIYYADKNQNVFITIKLSNPDSYEILSFTLNGKKYSNYMFENGSDMENLVLKVNVGDVGGIVEYTIDAIKYVDGTEIKDVRMDGNRTVKAGVRASDQTYVNVTNEKKTMTSISFDAQVVDLYSLIEKSGGYAKAVLYDGVNMLTKDVKIGEKTSVVFDNLTPNTVYQYGVVALYDNLSGNGAKLNTLYKKAVYTDTIVLFKDVQVGKESIEWGFLWNESFANKQMSAISLWQNGAKVQDVDTTATRLDGLKSNNKYTLKATYKNLQNQDETIAIEFVTYAKAVPTVEIANVQSTQTAISFVLNLTDTDNVGAITKIELLHGDDTPIAVENTDRTFANLLSNNNYTIKVTYTYDLNDGAGNRNIVKTADFKTLEKATPSVTISNLSSTQNTIECDVAYADVDGVGQIESIALFKGETQVATTSERTHVVFDALECDTEYTLVVAYKYDLNDGKGEQIATQKAKRYTSPQFEFVEATCANTSAVSKGEIIYFEAKVVNPSGVAIERIKINNKYYTPSSGTTKTSIIVNITVEDQFEGGNTALEVTEIQGTLRGQKVSIVPTQSNVANVFVNGELDVKSIKIVDEDGKECDMVVAGKQYYYLVSFNNKTGYSIDSICLGYSGTYTLANGNYLMQDAETAKIPVTFSIGVQHVEVTSVKYSSSSLGEKSKEVVGVAMRAVCVANEVPVVISTAEQLKSMNQWGYYVLGNDIDLAGTEWKDPSGFSGYFDGQGYAIRNMNFVGTVENTSFYWGLFKEATGVIKNLSLSGRLIVTMNSTGEKTYYAYAGGLCATTSGAASNTLTIENMVNDVSLYVTNNCGTAYVGGYIGSVGSAFTIVDSYNIGSVSATSTATYSSDSAYAYAYAYAGGLVGSGTVTIVNSYNTGSVSATSTATSSTGVGYASAYAYAGGLVGSGAVTIANSYNAGAISATSSGACAYAGGLVGCGHIITLIDSYNAGAISVTSSGACAYAGGVVGVMSGPSALLTMTNCYNIGMVSSSAPNGVSGLIVENYGTLTISNSYYTLSENSNSNYGEKKDSVAEIVAIMENLWDSSVWDFDNLDENGNPILRY